MKYIIIATYNSTNLNEQRVKFIGLFRNYAEAYDYAVQIKYEDGFYLIENKNELLKADALHIEELDDSSYKV